MSRTIRMRRLWMTTAVLFFIEAASVSAQQLPIGDGVYLSREHCEMAERGELDMIEFQVEKDGRAMSLPESTCLVADVKNIRSNRFHVESDCREFDTVFQYQFFLDVISDDHIRVEGEDLFLCKKGFLAAYSSPSESAMPVDDLIDSWADANEGCRGGFGHDPKTYAACDLREELKEKLTERGLCYGRDDQNLMDFEWHKCGKDSLR